MFNNNERDKMADKSNWWRFQALIGKKMKMKADNRHLSLIDRIVNQLQSLKNEELIESDWCHDNPDQCWTHKIRRIDDLVQELEHIYDEDLSRISNKQTLKIFKTTTDQGIKNDQEIKTSIKFHLTE